MERVGAVNPYTDPWVVVPQVTLLVTAITIGLVAAWFVRTGSKSGGPGISGQPGLLRAAAFLPILPLASSVTWPHHLVILLPVIWFSFIALAERGWPARSTLVLCALLLVFSVASRLPVGPAFGQPGFRAAQTTDPAIFLLANALFLATLALFFFAPWLLRAR